MTLKCGRGLLQIKTIVAEGKWEHEEGDSVEGVAQGMRAYMG
jgi:hypothetical protein